MHRWLQAVQAVGVLPSMARGVWGGRSAHGTRGILTEKIQSVTLLVGTGPLRKSERRLSKIRLQNASAWSKFRDQRRAPL